METLQKSSVLAVGQVVKTEGRRIAVPDWYTKWDWDIDDIGVVGNMPAIWLRRSGELWYIVTEKRHRPGLVCFLPVKYVAIAILAVQITAVRQRSALAEPLEYLEVIPPLDASWVGLQADDVFDIYKADDDEGISAVWYGKSDQGELDKVVG